MECHNPSNTVGNCYLLSEIFCPLPAIAVSNCGGPFYTMRVCISIAQYNCLSNKECI